MNDIRLLNEVGSALYGESWQSALSADIAVSDRSVRRWANGTDQIPWGVWFDFYRRLEARAEILDYWKAELYERVVLREFEPGSLEQFVREKDWVVEAHEPLDGRHSQKAQAAVQSLAEVRAFMKKHPGMIFRVTMPYDSTAEDRQEFEKMNIARV